MRRLHWLLLVTAFLLILVAALLTSSSRHNSFATRLRSSLYRWSVRTGLRPDAAACRRRAQDFLREDKLQEALAEIDKAARAEPDNACNECCRGMIARFAGDWPKSAAIYADALRRGGDCCSPAQLGLARAYLETGRANKARDLAARALKRDPRSVNAHCCTARVAGESDDWQTAVREYRDAVALDPDFLDSRLCLARACVQTGQLGEAEAHLGEAAKRDADYKLTHCCTAFLAEQKEDWATAAREYERALRLDPHLVRGCLGLANAHVSLNRPKEAMKMAQRAATEDPQNPDAQCCQGWICLETKRWPEAEQHFRRALQLGGRSAALHRRLGEALDHLNRPKEFLAEAQTAVKIAPKDAESHCCLSQAYGRAGRWQEAVKELEIASRLDPELPDLKQHLADARSRVKTH
jgi:Tfp pilus assembly protein PilF